MVKRGCFKLSAEMFMQVMNLPEDLEISKMVLNKDSYTIDVYGFSKSFENVSEGEYVCKKTLQWV